MGFMPTGNGLLAGLKEAKPFMDAAGSGMQAAQMFQEPEMPIQPPSSNSKRAGRPCNNSHKHRLSTQPNRLKCGRSGAVFWEACDARTS